jgi:hypothetical protein
VDIEEDVEEHHLVEEEVGHHRRHLQIRQDKLT